MSQCLTTGVKCRNCFTFSFKYIALACKHKLCKACADKLQKHNSITCPVVMCLKITQPVPTNTTNALATTNKSPRPLSSAVKVVLSQQKLLGRRSESTATQQNIHSNHNQNSLKRDTHESDKMRAYALSKGRAINGMKPETRRKPDVVTAMLSVRVSQLQLHYGGKGGGLKRKAKGSTHARTVSRKTGD